MKKISLVLAIVIWLLVSVNAFARDDSHLQDIKNWKTFYTKDGITYSYEYKDGSPLIPMMYAFKDAIGYQYFYIKTVLSQEEIDSYQKQLKKFKNVRPSYTIGWFRIDCKNEMIEYITEYIYSDKNELITALDMTENKKTKPIKMAGSPLELIPFNKNWIQQAKKEAEHRDNDEALKTELKKYGAEALVPINLLEVNPYEFEGHTIAVIVQFKKMLSKNSASFYSGYTDMEKYTNVYDEIIVTGIPKGTHFESGPFSPRMMLALKGKGTIEGTNAFGAGIKAPLFQWITIISGKQPSVFEEQRDANRKETLRNMENMERKWGQ